MGKPYLSVVIPAFQEEQRIEHGLRSFFDYLHRQPYAAEVIVVDDGSTDATTSVVQRFQQHEPALHLLRHPANRGKGAAVRTGMKEASGTFALIADADGSTPIEEVEKLLHAVSEGHDIAIGSRHLPGSVLEQRQPFVRRAMGRIGNLLFRLLFGLTYADTRCGFKLFSERARQTIFPLQLLERFGFDTEILVIAKEQGFRVAEVPVRWYDHGALSTVHPMRDSIRSLKELYEINKHLRAGQYRRH